MELNYIEIGNRIRQIRNNKSFSQAYLGKVIGVTSSQIGNIENARSHTSLESLVKIADALEVSTDEILFGYIRFGADRYYAEYSRLMIDCTEKEKEIILDIAKTLKDDLKQNGF